MTVCSCAIAQILATASLVKKLVNLTGKMANATKSIPILNRITKGISRYFSKLHLGLLCKNGLLHKLPEKTIHKLMKNNPMILVGAQNIAFGKGGDSFGKVILSTLRHHSFNIVKNQLIQKGMEYGLN
jgi:hypothetical protein